MGKMALWFGSQTKPIEVGAPQGKLDELYFGKFAKFAYSACEKSNLRGLAFDLYVLPTPSRPNLNVLHAHAGLLTDGADAQHQRLLRRNGFYMQEMAGSRVV